MRSVRPNISGQFLFAGMGPAHSPFKVFSVPCLAKLTINTLCSTTMLGSSGPLLCRVCSKSPLWRMEPLQRCYVLLSGYSQFWNLFRDSQKTCTIATLCCPGITGPSGHMWDAAASLQKLMAGLGG